MNVFDLLYKCFDSARNKLKIDAELTGSKLQVKNLNDLDTSTSLASTGSETTLIYASAGFLVENIVYSFECLAPPGATTGTHWLIIGLGAGGLTSERILDIRMPYDVDFYVNCGIQMVTGTPSSIYPSSEQARIQLLSKAAKVISTTLPLNITYTNDTNVPQTNQRKLRVKKLERAVIE